MSLDHHDNPPTPDELIQYGRDDVLSQFERFAKEEAEKGDGRAMRVLERFRGALGYRKRFVHHEDNGN